MILFNVVLGIYNFTFDILPIICSHNGNDINNFVSQRYNSLDITLNTYRWDRADVHFMNKRHQELPPVPPLQTVEAPARLPRLPILLAKLAQVLAQRFVPSVDVFDVHPQLVGQPLPGLMSGWAHMASRLL
jgi:hypothetical protein